VRGVGGEEDVVVREHLISSSIYQKDVSIPTSQNCPGYTKRRQAMHHGFHR
jgi:hypothetical protein